VQRADVFVLVLVVGGDGAPSAMDFARPAASPVLVYLYGLVYSGVYLLLRVFFLPDPHRVSPSTLFWLIFTMFGPASIRVDDQRRVRKTGKCSPVLLHDFGAVHLLFFHGECSFRCLPCQLRFCEVHRVVYRVWGLTVRLVGRLGVVVLAT
jgi:hypothetical protein